MCLPVDEQCVVTRQEEVVNKPFGLLEFVFGAVYVNLQYDDFLSLLLVGLCPCIMYIVMVSYVDSVVAVTVMHVLLFLLRVCMLQECEGARVTAMLVWGWMK